MSYAELQVTTHFSFLRGASSAQELFETAKALGIEALGVVDRNSLAGIVRALEASRATGLRLVVGCRLDLQDGMSLLVYPTDRAAYSRLTRLITLDKSRGGKNNCILHWDDVIAYNDGMIGVLVPDQPDDVCAIQLRKMAEVFGDRAYVSLCLRRRQNDQLRLHEISNLATRFKVKTVVTNDVLFHEPWPPAAAGHCHLHSHPHGNRRGRLRARAPRRPLSEATGGDGAPFPSIPDGFGTDHGDRSAMQVLA